MIESQGVAESQKKKKNSQEYHIDGYENSTSEGWWIFF